ncbi:MAG: MBL fold metallo-hydrolase [Chloroflexota bacterium]
MSIKIPEKAETVHTLDLNFLGLHGVIAAYLIPHAQGAILIESGPGSTLPGLQAGLQDLGMSVQDITDLFVTHIHLDHAGAGGWLARQGTQIHVHPAGAPHLLDPEKLLSSATRIYGDKMDLLWGEFLPVPVERLSVMEHNQVFEVGGVKIRALDTPGHANHHLAYVCNGICFSGDVGGVRLAGYRHLRLPTPPPEFHLETWRQSLKLLQDEFGRGSFTRLAPTHFGIFQDTDWHLAALEGTLDEIEQWVLTNLPAEPSFEQLNAQFLEWTRQRSLAQGLQNSDFDAYEAANPSWMSPQGIQRYWRKYRKDVEKANR